MLQNPNDITPIRTAPDAVGNPTQTFRQDGLAKIASRKATPYLVHVIKALDAAQVGPPPESSGAELPAAVEPAESADVSLLTLEEKRRILAQIARIDPLDCFDDTGAFDIARAKRVLPPGAVRHISVHETTRLNAEGQLVTERRINLGLVDPVSALRLDDQLERRRERTAAASSSPPDSDSPPPHPASPEYAHNLLRKKTRGLEEANHTLALLEKAFAEAKDRQLQLSKELEEKDRQLSRTLSNVEGDASNPSLPNPDQPQALSLSNGSPQCDTGCQPVSPKHQSTSQTLSSAEESKPLSTVEANSLSEAEKIAQKRRERAARSLEREIEYVRNTSGIGEFNAWLRSRGLDPENYPPPPLPTKPHAARPPP